MSLKFGSAVRRSEWVDVEQKILPTPCTVHYCYCNVTRKQRLTSSSSPCSFANSLDVAVPSKEEIELINTNILCRRQCILKQIGSHCLKVVCLTVSIYVLALNLHRCSILTTAIHSWEGYDMCNTRTVSGDGNI